MIALKTAQYQELSAIRIRGWGDRTAVAIRRHSVRKQVRCVKIEDIWSMVEYANRQYRRAGGYMALARVLSMPRVVRSDLTSSSPGAHTFRA